jgi:hypothetical protein
MRRGELIAIQTDTLLIPAQVYEKVSKTRVRVSHMGGIVTFNKEAKGAWVAVVSDKRWTLAFSTTRYTERL